MSAENVKWRVNMAVRRSNLPPAARLVMFVLSDRADAKTGVIPDKHVPSLADLADDTGHGESTVKAQLNVLEALGWVVRSRPDKKAQGRYASTGYRIQVGSPGEERTPHKRARSKPSQEAEEGQEMANSDSQEQASSDEQEGQEQASRGPGDSSERARSRPPYIKDDDLNDRNDRVAADAAAHAAEKPPAKAKPRASQKPETDNQRANRLAKIYTDQVKLSNFLAVRGVVAKAIAGECTDQQITDGLNRLVSENRSVSADQLRIAIFGPPVSANGYRPYRDSENPNYDGELQ